MRPRVEVTKQLLLINAGSTVVKRALSIGVVFWMHPYLIQRIPMEEYVLHPLLFGVIGLTPLVSGALASGLGRYLTEAYAKDDDRTITQITSTMTPILAGISLVMLALGGLFAWKIETILSIAPSQVENARLMFMLLLLPVIPRVAFGPYLLGFFVRQKLVHRDLIGLGAEMIKVVLLVYLLTEHEARVIWVAVAGMAAGFVELVVVLVISRRLVPALRFHMSEMRRKVIRPVFSFGWWTVIGQASTLIREMLDPIILQRFATPGDVVSFNLGSVVDRNLRRTVTNATDVAKPAATALVATDQEDRLRRAWFRMSRYGLWVTFAAAIPLIIFRTEFFQIWMGDAFEKTSLAPLIMAILLARFAASFPESGIHMLAVAQAEMRESTRRVLTIDTLNIGLTLLLVGVFTMGSLGAALATCSVALVLHPLLLWSFGLKLTGSKLSDWMRVSVLHGIVPGILSAPVWLAMHRFVRPDTWLELGLCGGIGWVVYALALFLTLRPEEREDLSHVKQRIAKRFAAHLTNPTVSTKVDPEEATRGWGLFKRKKDPDSSEEEPT